MNCSLNSLKGPYMADSIGEYYRGCLGRSLDCRSYLLSCVLVAFLEEEIFYQAQAARKSIKMTLT